MDRNQCISACFLAKLLQERKFLLSLCKPKTPVSVRYPKYTQAQKNQARTKKIALHEYKRGFAKCSTRMDVTNEQKKAKNAKSLGASELQNTVLSSAIPIPSVALPLAAVTSPAAPRRVRPRDGRSDSSTFEEPRSPKALGNATLEM